LSKRGCWSPYRRYSSTRKLCTNRRLCGNYILSEERKRKSTTLSTNRNVQVWCHSWNSVTSIRIASRKLRKCRNETGNRMPRKLRATWRTNRGLWRCWMCNIQRRIQCMVTRGKIRINLRWLLGIYRGKSSCRNLGLDTRSIAR
jgi:hypothetical protein